MNKNIKILITMLVLGLCWASNYALSFIQYLLYDPFKEALGCSNAQLGILMTIYGFGNVFGAPIGGWIADKFNYKKVFVASLLGNGILSIIFALNMNYASAIFVWIGLAVAGLLMNYPSHIKIVRMLVDESSQGKIFGLNEAAVGVGSIIINGIFLYIFARYTEGVAGIKAVIYGIAAISFACALASWFIIKDPSKNEVQEVKKENDKMTAKDFFIVLKSPATWMVGISIFTVYTFTVTMSYFTPYFTNVLGATVTFSGILVVIRTYILRLVGAPFGGWFADKIKSSTKVLLFVYIAGLIVLITFMNMPSTTPIYLLIALTLMIGFVIYMGRGVYYAVASEINIPRKYAASTVGIAAALGFSPDLFQFTIFGNWIDKYGNTGYTYMFTFQAIVLVIGILSVFYILKYKKGLKSDN